MNIEAMAYIALALIVVLLVAAEFWKAEHGDDFVSKADEREATTKINGRQQ